MKTGSLRASRHPHDPRAARDRPCRRRDGGHARLPRQARRRPPRPAHQRRLGRDSRRPAAALKSLVPGLALEGIAIRAAPAAAPAPRHRRTARPGDRQTHGSLLVLDEVLRRRNAGVDQRQPREHRPRRHEPAARRTPRRGRGAGARDAPRAPGHAHGAAPALRRDRDGHADRAGRRQAPPQPEPHRHRARQPRASIRPDGRRLATAIDEARASDAATRRFLGDASHELRTPIAALQASVETLLREQPERPERDRLEAAVARESERLGRLVNDLLGLARLEAHPTRTPDRPRADRTSALVEHARARAPARDHHADRWPATSSRQWRPRRARTGPSQPHRQRARRDRTQPAASTSNSTTDDTVVRPGHR